MDRKDPGLSHMSLGLQEERGSIGEGSWLSKASPVSKHKAVLQHLCASVGLG